jgi:sporulation protein YlmC with PRC-barrel domain
MKLSDLLDREVVSIHGEPIGYVADVRLVQDGPLIGPYAASMRLDGFIVVSRRPPRLLGYDRSVGPAYVRAAIRLLLGDPVFVNWQYVHTVDSDVITITHDLNQLPRLQDLPHHRSTT